MNRNARFALLSLVFVLSTLFFWMALNNVLIPSKAQLDTNLKIFVSEKQIACNMNGVCLAYLFGSTNEGVGVSAVQGGMKVSDNLEVVGLLKDTFCNNASFNLDTELGFSFDSASRSAKFALGALRGDAQLVSGVKCITGIILKPTAPITGVGTLQLNEAALWKATGAQTLILNPSVDSTAITINITADAPIPSITPPSGGGGGATCATKAQGDCNCDSAIDLADWESLRAAVNKEGAVSCDVNNDGVTNSLDTSVWVQNNQLLK